MDIAALILSVIALLCSAGCLIVLLAKNYFSSHTIQYVDPLKDILGGEIGKPKLDPYQDIDESLMMGEEDLDALRGKKVNF